MSKSPSLGITLLAENQEAKEALINAAFIKYEAATQRTMSVTIPDATPVELTGAQYTSAFRFSVSLSSAGTLRFPQVSEAGETAERFVMVTNTSTYSLSVVGKVGGSVVVNAGTTAFIYVDGTTLTNVVLTAEGPAPVTKLDDLSDVIISGTPSNGQIIKWNTSQGAFVLSSDNAGLSDAPNDTKAYNRKGGAWVEAATGIAEAPTDGKQYARSNSNWTEVVIPEGGEELPPIDGNANKVLAVNAGATAVEWINPPSGGGGGGEKELPPIEGNAGKFLAVNTGATDVEWVDPPSGGGGGVEEAPVDGLKYLRKDGTWVADSVPIPANTYRHWRVRALTLSGLRMSFSEMYALAAGAAVVTGTPFASSSSTTNVLDNIKDGNTNSWWESVGKSPLPWVGYTFPEAILIDQFSIRSAPFRADESPSAFVIEGSNSPDVATAEWTIVQQYNGVSWGASETKVFAAAPPAPVPVYEAPKDGVTYTRKDGTWVAQAADDGKLAFPTPAPGYRYYRVSMKVVASGNSYLGLSEFDLRATPGVHQPAPTILSATDKGVAQTGTALTNLAKWFDGSTSTNYEKSGKPEFVLILDYTNPVTFYELFMASPWVNEMPDIILIEGSNDNVTYTVIHNLNLAPNATPRTVALTPATGVGRVGLVKGTAGNGGQVVALNAAANGLEFIPGGPRVLITQAAYDALATKDPNTLYLVPQT